MGLFSRLFGGGPSVAAQPVPPPKPTGKQEPSPPKSVNAKFRQVLELRTKQGWSQAYIEGETALILSLLQRGVSPEDIAGATLRQDWLSLVSEFRKSPAFAKTMGLG